MEAALDNVLSAVLRDLSAVDGIECSPDLVFTFGGEKIAEAEAAGDTLLLDVLCHALDAPALVEEYSCCSASGPLAGGRIRFFFVAAPSPEERSALLEAFRSAVDRVSPGRSPDETAERGQDV
jgi:hypothetical protein